jgi:hypothetical protein
MSTGKIYRGYRGGPHGVTMRGIRVGPQCATVDERPLPMRLDLVNHSPTGFGWGYGGSGPAQLALALLADHLGDDEEALDLYQDFKWRVVPGLPAEGWTLTSADIDAAIEKVRAAREAPCGMLPEDVPF